MYTHVCVCIIYIYIYIYIYMYREREIERERCMYRAPRESRTGQPFYPIGRWMYHSWGMAIINIRIIMRIIITRIVIITSIIIMLKNNYF